MKLLRHLFLALLLLTPALAAAVTPAAPPAQAETTAAPAGLYREDPDGGLTLTTLIQDEPGVLHRPTAVSTGPEQASLYVNTWTRSWGAGESSLMMTYGLETLAGDRAGARQLVRVPLVVVENATPSMANPGGFAGLADSILIEDVIPIIGNSLSYPVGHVAPDAVWLMGAIMPALGYFGFEDYPADEGAYIDHPTLYAWFVMRNEPQSLWAGYYLERTGSHAGAPTDVERRAEQRTEMGVAFRRAGWEDRTFGAYLEQEVGRELTSTHWRADNRVTAGVEHNDYDHGTVDVRMSEERWDERGTLLFLPEDQRNDIVLGTEGPDGKFMPLLGSRSENRQDFEQDGDAPQTQLVSFGPYVDGEYQPAVGLRWQSERYPRIFWPIEFVNGGALGDQQAGDWEIDAGTFVDGEFVPLTGVHLDDAWEGAQYGNQTMVTVGAWADGDFEPLLAFAYSGETPALPWALCFAKQGGIGAPCKDWEMIVGTFANDEFHPLLTIDYRDDYENAKHPYQAMITIGTFAAGEKVPLFGYTYAGEKPLNHWAAAWVAGGTLGARATDWRMEVGTFAGGVFKPMLTTEYHDDYAAADHPYQAMITVGTVVEGKDQPLLGFTYDAEQPLQPWAFAFARGGGPGAPGALSWEMEIGTFVDHAFVPLLGWTYENGFEGGRHTHQAMVTAGPYALGSYQPVVGVTYDADQPLVPFAQNLAAGSPEANGDLLVSVGTFLGDHYVPVAGVEYAGTPDGSGGVREEARAGGFVLGYDHFVPLAGATWEGDDDVTNWLLRYASGGGPGAASGDERATVDAFLLDEPAARAIVETRDDRRGDAPQEGTVAVGAYARGSETPRAALRYHGDRPLADYARAFLLGGGPDCACGEANLDVGVEDPATGTFTPLARVTYAGGANATVTPLPPPIG